jgi:phenylacetate-coenzyme A ligase PaaK-like adenylate-forming protein
LAGIEPQVFELADLPRLPILTKAEMMANFDDLLTDRRLSRHATEQVIARTAEEPIPLFDEYLCQASGGSSGRRGIFVLDAEAMVEYASSILRPTVAARGGGLPTGGLTIAFVAAASAVHATGIAPQILHGSPIRFIPVPATLPFAALVDRLEAIQPHALYGYPSMLARLAIERRAGRLCIAPATIVSTSETLLDEQRAVISVAFGAPLVNTFATSEGLVGVSDPDQRTLTFASDLSIVEVIDDADRPIPAGVRSAKVLVTNLYNRVQPLIRYGLEDSFVRVPEAADSGHFRATVEGRADDILHFGATSIHPLVIRAVMVKTPEVMDYQVHQTALGIDLSVVVEGQPDLVRLHQRLCAALKDAGLTEPVVGVRAVSDLERSPGAGKLRRFVPFGAGERRPTL